MNRRDFLKQSAIAIGSIGTIFAPTIIRNVLSESPLEQKAKKLINTVSKEFSEYNQPIHLKQDPNDLEGYCPKNHSRLTTVALANILDAKKGLGSYRIIANAPLNPFEIKISISEVPKSLSGNKQIEPNYLHLIPITNKKEVEIYWDTTKLPITIHPKERDLLYSRKINLSDEFHAKALNLYKQIRDTVYPMFVKEGEIKCYPIKQSSEYAKYKKYWKNNN